MPVKQQKEKDEIAKILKLIEDNKFAKAKSEAKLGTKKFPGASKSILAQKKLQMKKSGYIKD